MSTLVLQSGSLLCDGGLGLPGGIEILGRRFGYFEIDQLAHDADQALAAAGKLGFRGGKHV